LGLMFEQLINYYSLYSQWDDLWFVGKNVRIRYHIVINMTSFPRGKQIWDFE
jgi:hypothetical protein